MGTDVVCLLCVSGRGWLRGGGNSRGGGHTGIRVRGRPGDRDGGTRANGDGDVTYGRTSVCPSVDYRGTPLTPYTLDDTTTTTTVLTCFYL